MARRRFWIPLITLLVHLDALSAEFSVPVELPHSLIVALLQEQLGAGADQPLIIATDAKGCGRIELDGLTVRTRDEASLVLGFDMHLRVATPVLGRCMLPFNWQGGLELIESLHQLGPSTVGMRVIDSQIKPKADDRVSVPGTAWELVKRFVHPKFNTVNLELHDVLVAVRNMLELVVISPAPPASSPASVELVEVKATSAGLDLVLHAAPPTSIALPGGLQTEFTEEGLREWDARWQTWDAFATWLIKSLFDNPADAGLRVALQEILLDGRYALRDALVTPDPAEDPVRELFLRSWDGLQAILRSRLDRTSATTGLRVLSFVAAGDALKAAERATSGVGLRINRQGLRYLVRVLQPDAGQQALDYAPDVDPELRRLLGLTPELELSVVNQPRVRPGFQLFRSAWAEEPPTLSRKEIDIWVPTRQELTRYLAAVEGLIARIADIESLRGKIPKEHQSVYGVLLRATAWQETCWRQFVRQGGQVQTIRSSAGSVGLMQVNKHVWRGVYDLERLENDIAYNAMAGNEILVHYLVDYAIRKRENEESGGQTNLARATYAAYNGGPGHLSRYRNPNASNSLKAIDAAFWSKYQAIERTGFTAVKQCFG